MMRNSALTVAAAAAITLSMGGAARDGGGGGGGSAALAAAFVAAPGAGGGMGPPALTPPSQREQEQEVVGASYSILRTRPSSSSSCSTSGRGVIPTRSRPAQPRSSALRMSTAAPPEEATATGDVPLPAMDSDGLYGIENAEQHRAFLEANPDKIVVLKFYAPWCRACKGLAPKFLKLKADPKYADLPILWAQMSVQHNKDYIKSLGVLALPSVLMYAGTEGLVENFPCGPSKIPIFKQKFADLLNTRIDPDTRKLKAVDCTLPEMAEAEPCTERSIVDKGPATELSVGDVVVSDAEWSHLRTAVPFFKDFTDEEFTELMTKATLQTFEPGQLIMRQGMPGSKFFVIQSGEVEVSVRGAFEDPLTTPANYLGAVVNRLSSREWFGERSLITGQPRAASIKALEKTRCFAFDQADIPTSSVLSGKQMATDERLAQVDEKYGLDFYDIDFIKEQFTKANSANQARGSANHPEVIPGVDNDAEIEEPSAPAPATMQPSSSSPAPAVGDIPLNGNEDTIVALLVRFRLLRHASRCFEYIMGTQPKFGDPGEVRRRSLLVNKLTWAQRDEFENVYKLIDADGDGNISVMELKRVMESIGDDKSDEELTDMINKANPAVDGNVEIGFQDFMGVMAEAEFYYLFMETFESLDKDNVGFLKASELDRVLCGMRDLVSNDRKSIIDVEDTEMLINYEQFAKMLLGAEAAY